jgi:D-beta-D-heptose 7-phosphate kinase/D-beta-D-heptose 1-phosphate adenosyltransferase
MSTVFPTEKTIESMANITAVVVGDIMLDSFIYGETTRISPEAPVPVLKISSENSMLGGSGNVVANLRALGANVMCIGCVGADSAADSLKSMLNDAGVDIGGLIIDSERPTNVKTRFISGQQQVLRADYEQTHGLSPALEKECIQKVEEAITKAQAVILSDYNKGVLTKGVVQATIKAAKKAGIPVLVDPKGNDFSIYKGAQVVTPNKKELSEATSGHAVETNSDIEEAAGTIIKKCGIDAVVATRSAQGMSVVRKKGNTVHIPTQVREVFDVSGAGDTVIAVLAAAMATGVDIEEAAYLANKAGSAVVGKKGTAPITAVDLLRDTGANLIQADFVSIDDAKEKIKAWQAQGVKVGFTNGCFDILHHGHVSYLQQAKGFCDVLVVGLNSDASVKLLKGEERPINEEQARASVIGALASVDMVVLFGAEKPGDDNTPSSVIDALRPDIIFKGGDYTVEQMPEAKIVQAYGGEVKILQNFEGYSTTNIIKKSKDQAA